MTKEVYQPSQLDWDDSILIENYDKCMAKLKGGSPTNTKSKKIAIGTEKPTTPDPGKKSSKKSDEKWKVGDYCRAPYSVDDLWYEAKIVEIHDKRTCTVEFFGYRNKEKVEFLYMKPSNGLEAQAFQEGEASEYIDQFNEDGNEDDGNDSEDSNPSELTVEDLPVNQVRDLPQEPVEERPRAPMNNLPERPRSAHVRMADINSPVPHPQRPGNQRSLGRRRPIRTDRPYTASSGIPPPPLGPNFPGGIARGNPALSALLMSWYMAGYNTGYYEGSRGGQPLQNNNEDDDDDDEEEYCTCHRR